MNIQNISLFFEISISIIGIATLVFNTGKISNQVKNNEEKILKLEERIDMDIKEIREKQNDDFKDLRKKVDKIYEIMINNYQKNI